MKTSSLVSETGLFNVEICATLLTDKPPKLPLREELPSLGFEVIYNGSGVGAQTVEYEAQRAVKRFQKSEQMKDLKKRRFFPKSSKRIKEILAERKRIEHELKIPHAVSYESYEYLLYEDALYSTDYSSSSSPESCSEESSKAWNNNRLIKKMGKMTRKKKKRTRGWGGLFRRSKSYDDSSSLPESVSGISRGEKSMEEILGDAAFKDILAPDDSVDDHHHQLFKNILQQQPSSGRLFSGRETVGSTTLRSGATTEPSSHASSTRKDGMHNMEIQFTYSPDGSSKHGNKYELSAVGEDGGDEGEDEAKEDGDGLNDSVKSAFAEFDSACEKAWPAQQSPAVPDADILKNVFADLDSSCEKDWPTHHQSPAGVEAAFNDLDPTNPAYSPSESKQEESEKKEQEDDEASTSSRRSLTKTEKADGTLQEMDDDSTSSNSSQEDTQEDNNLVNNDAFEDVDSDVYKDIQQAKEGEKATPDVANKQESSRKGAKGGLSNKLIEALNDGTSVSIMTENSDAADGSSCGSVKTLFDALACTNTPPKEVEDFVISFPELSKVREPENDRLPLHVLCNRGLPDRSRIEATSLTEYLVRDIASHKHTIGIVFSSYEEASLEKDKNGDLPIHLLARALMKWEATWYETVYSQASKESGPNGRTKVDISKLYKGMSESIGILLEPCTESAAFCREAGSVGRLLPLHIACIFTSSVPTLRHILGAYPEAARIPCDLSGLQTFVPDKSMPLELHEGLSTDFPKWETKKKHERHSNIDWSHPVNGTPDLEDCIRRSDLLFAYNPNIEPYRFEKTRIRRLESRIRFNTSKIDGSKSTEQLETTARLLWIWMCTFREDKNLRPTYVKSVQRVVDGLPLDALQHLASIEVADGKPLVEVANNQCAKIIRRSLGDMGVDCSCPKTGGDESISPKSKPSLPEPAAKSSWKDTLELLPVPLKGRMGVTLLSRRIFNIKEESFPTAFVILPYQLARNPDGKLGMASPNSAQIALKFAEYLLRLTDPRSILYFLDAKSIKHYGQSIYESGEDEAARQEAYEKIREYEGGLLGLYGNESAYMYLVDEVTGIPVVPLETGGKSYPIVLRDPPSMVRKLLPLMLVGMILMRGDKALSVLVDVLLDDCITVIPPSCIQAAKDLYIYLQMQDRRSEVVGNSGIDEEKLQARLEAFVAKAETKKRCSGRPKNGSTEWNVELSILKMLIDMNDQHHSFCGLEAVNIRNKGVVWYSPSEEDKALEDGKRVENDKEGADARALLSSEDPESFQDDSIKTDQSVVALRNDDELESRKPPKIPSSPGKRAANDKEGADARAPLSSEDPESFQDDSIKTDQSVIALRNDDELESRKPPKIPSSPKVARVEEVRKRFDAMRRDQGDDKSQSTNDRVPDVDELSQKHEMLTKQYENISFDYNSTSGSASDSSLAALGFPQPANESSDEDTKKSRFRGGLAEEKVSSSDDEAIQRIINDKRIIERLPLKIYESNDDNVDEEDLAKRGFEVRVKNKPPRKSENPTRRRNKNDDDEPIIRITEEEDTSADELKPARVMSESAGEETDRSEYSRASSIESSDWVRRRGHSMLFDELAFTNSPTDDDSDDSREPSETPRAITAIGNESARVWQEITSQLDNSGMYFEDTQVIRLKARLAQEAKQLAFMNKRVKIIEREKDLVIEAENNKCRSFLIESSKGFFDFDYCGFDEPSLRKARHLLVRLCTLEDQLLIDEIEVQHLKLETHSLDGEIESLKKPSTKAPAAMPPQHPGSSSWRKGGRSNNNNNNNNNSNSASPNNSHYKSVRFSEPTVYRVASDNTQQLSENENLNGEFIMYDVTDESYEQYEFPMNEISNGSIYPHSGLKPVLQGKWVNYNPITGQMVNSY